MRISPIALLGGFAAVAFAPTALAQYNAGAGHSAAAPVAVSTEVRRADGTVTREVRMQRAPTDQYGNAAGRQYDLAVDGAFDGQTVAVLQLYTAPEFDFSAPRAALREKGFSVFRWSNGVPTVAALRAGLAHANQFWLVSGDHVMLSDEHLRAIQDFFNAGHGVYIWGDNDPYYADANQLARRLFDAHMDGNLMGNQVVGLQTRPGGVGLYSDHLLTTGIERLFEGITIATIHPSAGLTPLLYGSADNLVTAFYDHDGRRAIVDGGFTRLYVNWDSAGSARYVKNAAAWLANVERFGPAVAPHATVATSAAR